MARTWTYMYVHVRANVLQFGIIHRFCLYNVRPLYKSCYRNKVFVGLHNVQQCMGHVEHLTLLLNPHFGVIIKQGFPPDCHIFPPDCHIFPPDIIFDVTESRRVYGAAKKRWRAFVFDKS